MADDKADNDSQQFNAGDLLKKNIVAQVFKSMDDACKKQETISDNSHETSFTKRTDLIEGLLWKYTPDDLREMIITLRKQLDDKLISIDKTELSEKNKQLNKQKASYDKCIEIFKILEVVLTNSPISIEYVQMEVMGDFQSLIRNIRQSEPVNLFATEIDQ